MVEDSTVETESMNSCDEAVRHIADRLDCESKKRLASAPRDDLILLLHGWGTQIRNECHLWENEPLRASCSRKKGAKGVMDAESASMVIIEGVWELVKNQ